MEVNNVKKKSMIILIFILMFIIVGFFIIRNLIEILDGKINIYIVLNL